MSIDAMDALRTRMNAMDAKKNAKNAMDAKKNAKNAMDAKKNAKNAMDAPRARGARWRSFAYMRVHARSLQPSTQRHNYVGLVLIDKYNRCCNLLCFMLRCIEFVDRVEMQRRVKIADSAECD